MQYSCAHYFLASVVSVLKFSLSRLDDNRSGIEVGTQRHIDLKRGTLTMDVPLPLKRIYPSADFVYQVFSNFSQIEPDFVH